MVHRSFYILAALALMGCASHDDAAFGEATSDLTASEAVLVGTWARRVDGELEWFTFSRHPSGIGVQVETWNGSLDSRARVGFGYARANDASISLGGAGLPADLRATFDLTIGKTGTTFAFHRAGRMIGFRRIPKRPAPDVDPFDANSCVGPFNHNVLYDQLTWDPSPPALSGSVGEIEIAVRTKGCTGECPLFVPNAITGKLKVLAREGALAIEPKGTLSHWFGRFAYVGAGESALPAETPCAAMTLPGLSWSEDPRAARDAHARGTCAVPSGYRSSRVYVQLRAYLTNGCIRFVGAGVYEGKEVDAAGVIAMPQEGDGLRR